MFDRTRFHLGQSIQFPLYGQKALEDLAHRCHLVYRLWSWGINCIIDRRAASKRQVQYEAVLKGYSDNLRPGMSRREVESYLRRRGHPFQRMCCVGRPLSANADLVRIGQERAPCYCSEYRVYVAFEFDTTEPHDLSPDFSDSDRLQATALFPWLQGCL
jgi:hypothetical protein